MGLGKGYYRLFLHAIEKIIAMNNSFPSFRGAELWGQGEFPPSFRDLFSFCEFFSLFNAAPTPIKNLLPPTLPSFTNICMVKIDS